MPNTGKRRSKLTRSYREYLLERLKASRERRVGYLAEAIKEEPEVFLIALRDVVDALGGVTWLSRKTGMHRVSLHSLLSARGNPRLESLTRILEALGVQLAMQPLEERRSRKKAG